MLWNRAPEVILAQLCKKVPPNYNSSADMWSFGCVLLEMLMRLGRRLERDFLNAENSAYQLKLIFALVGCSKDLVGINKNAHQYIKDRATYYGFDGNMSKDQSGTLKKKLQDLRKVVEQVNKTRIDKEKINMVVFDNACNLVEQLLQIDPAKRPTPQQALEHPFMKSFNDHPKWEKLKESFHSQLRDHKTGELSLQGAFAVWYSEMAQQKRVSKQMLRKYRAAIIEFFRSPEKTKAKIKKTAAAPAATPAPAAISAAAHRRHSFSEGCAVAARHLRRFSSFSEGSCRTAPPAKKSSQPSIPVLS